MNETLRLLLMMLLLSVGYNELYCQERDNNQVEWIKLISQYRDELFNSKGKELVKLQKIFENWKEKNISEKEKIDLTFHLLKLVRIDKHNFKYIKKLAKKNMPESIIAKYLTEKELDAIYENSEILDLIHEGILDSDFPFKIKGKAAIYEELSMLDLEGIRTFGDVGSGVGTISLLINMKYPRVIQYVNEIDRSFLDYQKEKLEKTELGSSKSVTFVKGTKKSTGLEGLDLDAVLLRNALHHFSRQEDMIRSVIRSLKEGGKIILIESLRELDNDGDICKKAMSKKELMEVLKAFNLKIVKERVLDEKIFFECMTY